MSSTTSIRISEDLQLRLRQFAVQAKLSKNRVIVTAIEDYLERHDVEQLAAEARRQSRLASEKAVDDESWSDMADDSGWT